MRVVVIIGATSSLASNCALIWAQQPIHFILVGRDLAKLENLANRIVERNSQSKCESHVADFADPESVSRLVQKVCQSHNVDTVLIAHGYLPEPDEIENSLDVVKRTIEVNAMSVIMFAQAFIGPMIKKNQGTLALISSVAGDRGRKTNSIYGATKAMVSHYAQGLQHRLATTNVKVVLIKPGPTATPMTRNYKSSVLRLAAPESVARTIVKGIDDGRQLVYTPPYWRFVMGALCLLPRFIFHRLNI